jgi:hypothetical protein
VAAINNRGVLNLSYDYDDSTDLIQNRFQRWE